VRAEVKIIVTRRALTKTGHTPENNPKDARGHAQLTDALANGAGVDTVSSLKGGLDVKSAIRQLAEEIDPFE
jgi:hypothetical protein